MLSYVPLHHAETCAGIISPKLSGKMVFSAVVVFVHPQQHLSTISEGVDFLLVLSGRTSPVPCSILCHLLEKGIGEFYPCIIHSIYLVLQVVDSKDDPILCLDMPIQVTGEFVVCDLHRWICPMGHITVLPPVFNPDIGLPNVCLIEKSGNLWTNKQYTVPTSPGSTGTLEYPAMTGHNKQTGS